jgi:hypothetical protein
MTETNIKIFSAEEMPESEQDANPPSIGLIKRIPGTIKRESMTYIAPVPNARADDHGYHESEYPLIDIGAAEDTDSYIFQANLKKLALAMKEGHTLVGKNKETIKYIKERFRQIEVAQDQTLRSFLIEIMGTLLRYHNCYIIKARSVDKSGGKVRTAGTRKLKPVAGYFVVSPDTMRVKPGTNNRIISYKHIMPDGRFKIYRPEDVIFISVNKKPHFLTATPPWHPVIEDVTALRRIEEHVENLVYQHIYPLFQYKVGTESAPMQRYEDGVTEVDIVRAMVRDMPSDGMLVTPERHEISGLGAESRSIRPEPFIEHFKKRVITGSGMSQLDFGDGDTANRATADSMSKLAHGNVKFYQQCLADSFNFEILRELLLESTFGFDPLSEENNVELRFTEIDHEAQIKLQNHYMLLFTSNLISRTEARSLSGWEAMTEEESEDCALCVVEIPKMEKQGELEVEKTEATSRAQAANRAATAKQQPSNQHGTSTGPTKARSSVQDGVAAEIYGSLARDLKEVRSGEINLGFIRQIFMAAEGQIKRRFKTTIDRASISGLQGFSASSALLQRVRNISDRIHGQFETDVTRLFRATAGRTAAELAVGRRDNLTIDRLEYRIRFIERTLTHRARILSKVAAMKASGFDTAVIKATPGGEDFDVWNNIVIELDSVTQEDLPPFHPNCRCELEPIGEIQNGR